MKLLFVDCESNGLPIDFKASYTDVEKWPRVISLAWILTDENGEVLNRQHHIIKPDGWEIPTEEFWIENGFSQEKSEADGVPIKDVLTLLMADKMEADVLIAHNLSFDHRVIWAEFIRSGFQPRSGMNKICTMQKSTTLCRIPGKNGKGLKWPKLIELYTFLFGVGFEGAHDAMADITATKDCFFEMLRLGSVELPAAEQPAAEA